MTAAEVILARAQRLVAQANREGLVLTIEQRHLLPPAMGNYTTEISVRQARHALAKATPAIQHLPSDDTEGGEI